jgi:hypothetical protein
VPFTVVRFGSVGGCLTRKVPQMTAFSLMPFRQRLTRVKSPDTVQYEYEYSPQTSLEAYCVVLLCFSRRAHRLIDAPPRRRVMKELPADVNCTSPRAINAPAPVISEGDTFYMTVKQD